MSSNESQPVKTEISTDGSNKNGPVSSISKELLAEAFLLIYNGGLWDNLSNDCQQFGQSLLQHLMDNGVKLKAPEPVGLSLSLPEYLQIINSSLNLKQYDSQFWQIVVKITYLMMTVEKDPLMAKKLKEQSAVGGFLSEIFEE